MASFVDSEMKLLQVRVFRYFGKCTPPPPHPTLLFLSNVVEIHTKYGSPRSGGPDAINVVVVGASVCRSVCDLFREPNWERFQPSPFG